MPIPTSTNTAAASARDVRGGAGIVRNTAGAGDRTLATDTAGFGFGVGVRFTVLCLVDFGVLCLVGALDGFGVTLAVRVGEGCGDAGSTGWGADCG
jgi:hypothetical protein